MKRIISLILVCCSVFALFAGCSKTEETTTAATSGAETTASESTGNQNDNTFTYAITGDPGNILNPITADDRFMLMEKKMTFAPLYSYMSDGSKYYYIAESVEASEDGLTYTCKIKPDLKWTDGEALNADDVVFSYNAFNTLKEDLIVNGQPVEAVKIDDLTVEFKIPSVSASIEENLSAPYIIPQHIFEGKENYDISLLNEEVVGCGPYLLDEYKTGEYIKFTKNPDYVGGEVGVETVIFRIIENDDTAKLALQNGEVDAWIALPAKMDGLEDFDVYTYSEGRVAYLRLNRMSENLQDLEYRQGILYALNRADILSASYISTDYAKVGYSFLPYTSGYYTEEVEKYEYDPEKAKELVAGGPTSLKLCYVASDAAQSAQAVVIQAELAAVGVNVELMGVDQATYIAAHSDVTSTEYDMFLGGYVMSIDPDGFSSLFVTEGWMNFNNPAIDEAFAAAKVELDSEKRAEMYDELQMMVSQEALFYPLGSNLRILVTNKRVGGVEEAQLVPVFTFEDPSKLTVN